MPRSSRHKSHKQSKHSSKEVRECSDSEVEDVKMKESGSGLILDRVLKDSGHLISGEKRKLSSHVKEGKDLSGHRNGEFVEEYVSSKRRKEKAESNGGDRWNGGDGREGVVNKRKGESLKNDGEKGSKFREGKGDVKGRSSKRHESGGDMKQDNGAVLEEKEYNRSGSRSEKRKSEKEKDGKDIKELKEKERVSEKGKKGVDSRHSKEVNVDGDVMRKPEMQPDDFGKDGGHVKKSKNNTEWPSQNEMRIADTDEKRVKKKKESIGDLDKYQDDVRDGELRHSLSRSERVKEGRSFDEMNKEANYRDKDYEDLDRDVKYHDDLDRDDKHRDDKYRDDGDRDSRHRDEKHRDEGDRDGRRREDKHREDSSRDSKRRDDKHRGDSEKDGRRRDDRYREDGEKDNRRKDDKHKEDVETESRHNDSRYYDEAERDARHKVVRLKEDTDRDIRHKEDKYRDEHKRENRHRDKLGDDIDREKRFREGKYRDDRLPKDRSGDKSDNKRSRDENHASVFHSRKSSFYDDGDDRLSRYKDDRAEKHSSGLGRGDSANDRGRSNSKTTEMDLSATHYRRQSSPSSGSHIMNNQYRHSKQDESKFKDYGVTPNRELEKKQFQRDDTNSGELTAERRMRPDPRESSMPLMDKSPSSIMSERRHSRIDVRRNLDDSGPRYGGSRDGKDYSGREPRGSRDVGLETFQGDEFSKVDGDNGSVSSPFARNGHLSNSAKSLLPPPPFRSGVDSPSPFGMSDDDSRGKSSNRHRRLGDASMGRMQGNSWRGPPNWPSPVANGFMPFQHGPPPVGFHPGMQQFPAPPLFGVRPSMDMNHHGLPYPMSDSDRFSGHVRPMGWRNLVDDSCPPPLHGWEANNAAFNEDSHIFGRPDWENSRNLPGARNNSGSTEMGALEKQNTFVHGEADEYIAGQFTQNVKTQHGSLADISEAGPPSGFVERETIEPSLKPKEISTVERESEEDEDHLWHAYLSKLDISADLTGPELYIQCANLHAVDQSLLIDGDESKILYLEEVMDVNEASNKVPSTFIFTATDDSVFQKAMILYNKNKQEFKSIKSSSLSPHDVENTGSFPNMSEAESMSVKEVAGGEQELIDHPNISKEEKDDVVDKSEGSTYATCNTSMEVQVSSDIEERDISETAIEGKLGLETAAGSPSNAVDSEITMSNDATLTNDMPMEEKKGMNVICAPSLIPDVPEAVMPESIESESVNLSRIHDSPKSTH